ncbi:MAG UNVERIFIED_CONTAM: TraC family protein [Rickettsiaceae bacterium]|jgi:type-IV secretion system protein TraC
MKNLYEDFANFAAKAIGFNTTDIETGSRALSGLLDDSYFGGEPLKNYLCYRYFEPKTENFLMTNGAAGFLLEICPLVGVNDGVTKSLNLFFANELPKDGFLQFFLLASSDIDDFLAFWKKGRTNVHPVLKRITELRAEYLRKKAAEFRASGKKLPRCFRIFVSYSKICKQHNEASLSEVQQFKNKLMDKLLSLSLQPVVCGKDELVRLCREIFEVNPGIPANYAPVNKLDTINNQAMQHGNHYIRLKNGFVNKETGMGHRAYNFAKIPDFWSLMQNIELLGNAENNPIPARFALSLIVTNDFNTNKSLIVRGKRVIDSAERPYSRHDKTLQEEAYQWRDIIHSLEAKGESALSESFCFFISTKIEDLDRAESDIMTILSNQSWQIKPLDYYHLEAILGAMPMHGANFWYELKRHKLVQTSLSSEVVSKLPIHGEWYGVPISGVPFIGRRGQIFNWNPYHRITAGNFNINVIGPSGVGKSVFLQELASTMISQDARVFVLDIGKSYASLAQLLGGEIIEFGAISTYTINPFNGLKRDLSDIDFNQIVICAMELLSIMCGARGEFENATLESAIKEAVINNEFNLDLEKFVQFLNSSDDPIHKRFATSLFSYTPKGVYGKYFSGDRSCKF